MCTILLCKCLLVCVHLRLCFVILFTGDPHFEYVCLYCHVKFIICYVYICNSVSVCLRVECAPMMCVYVFTYMRYRLCYSMRMCVYACLCMYVCEVVYECMLVYSCCFLFEYACTY